MRRSTMTTEDKVELINQAVGNSLSIAYYTAWQLSSYKKNTRFGFGEQVRGKTFKEVVDKAFDIISKEKENKSGT